MSGVKSADTLHVAYAGITGPNQEMPFIDAVILWLIRNAR